jgi:hypothetical protein
MPYRHAHWAVLLLLPVIVVAFWPGYFGHLRTAPLALHGHGISASIWLILLAVQLWSIHARRPHWHRTAGLALFVVVPVFAGASVAAIQGGFALFATRSDPFHAAFGVRLGMGDLIALVTFVGLVRHALVERRHPRTHAAAMLATALLVLPPILGRLVPIAPGFADMAILGRRGFALAFHIGQAMAIVAALTVYLADRRGQPFLLVALSLALQSVLFETWAASGWWAGFAVRTVAVPTPLLFVAGVAAAAATLWQGWQRVPPRRRADRPTIPIMP